MHRYRQTEQVGLTFCRIVFSSEKKLQVYPNLPRVKISHFLRHRLCCFFLCGDRGPVWEVPVWRKGKSTLQNLKRSGRDSPNLRLCSHVGYFFFLFWFFLLRRRSSKKKNFNINIKFGRNLFRSTNTIPVRQVFSKSWKMCLCFVLRKSPWPYLWTLLMWWIMCLYGFTWNEHFYSGMWSKHTQKKKSWIVRGGKELKVKLQKVDQFWCNH